MTKRDSAAADQAKIEVQSIEALSARAETSLNEVIKALIALNSGGVIAVLGFLQAVIGKQINLAAFKLYALNSISIYGIGIIVGAVAFLLRYQHMAHAANRSTHAKGWAYASFIAIGASLFAFLGAGAVLIEGLAKYL